MIKKKVTPKVSWFVYVLLCADGTLYTGITTNVERRVMEHNSTKKGAKYTRVRLPVSLAYSEKAKDRSKAAVREAALKKLSRKEKLSLIETKVKTTTLNTRQKSIL